MNHSSCQVKVAMYVHSLPLEANLYFQFNLPDGCKISTQQPGFKTSTQQPYLYYASCSNTQDWSSTPFSHLGILIPKEWLLVYYIFIWLSLLSMLILVLHKKSLQRILQTPHHYRFKVTSRTHPTFSKHYQSMTKGKPAATGTHKTIPSCCKLQYYCSLKMYDPIHILLYQKTTSPSYALTKCESSIQLFKQLGTTSIRKVNQKS